MNYQKITPISIADGDGCRVVLWVSGCEHNCYNCHNPDTHDPTSGFLFDEAAEKRLFDLLMPNYISGLTFSGGDPLHPLNRGEVTRLARRLKTQMPEKTIWLYTGYLYKQICDLEVLKFVDVLVDGPYVDAQRCVGKFYGSTNQRIIQNPPLLYLGLRTEVCNIDN